MSDLLENPDCWFGTHYQMGDFELLFFPGEIDRCLKRVQEGVDTFEDTWQKVGVLLAKD